MSRFGVAIVENVSVSTLQTVLQLIAASNRAIEIVQLGIGFNGTSSTAEPVDVTLARQSDAGSGSSSVTPVKYDDSTSESLQTTAIKVCTSEPTTGDVVFTQHVHPQTGLFWTPPAPLIVGGGDRLGLRCAAGASVALNAYIVFKE